MIVRLKYVDSSVALYLVVRNNKIISTRLDDFVKDFCILNYRNKSPHSSAGRATDL